MPDYNKTNPKPDILDFGEPQKENSIIKVIGVGGGGGNAVNHMYREGIHDVSFVLCNTDAQALDDSPVPVRLQLGKEGLGAGNRPARARQAALESEEDIRRMLDDGTKMAFITAGMGGGTGTGAAPVIAQVSKEMGILTVGIVTIPFRFEGPKKIDQALDGVEEMAKHVDALLVINNERLREIYPDLTLIDAFGKADDTLSIAARSISELITTQGMINLDFNDVNTTLRDGGVAIISSGYGEGEHRVTKAIEDALESPLLKNRDVYGSKKILMNFYFSRESHSPFKMAEVDEMRQFMTNFSPEVDVIWGVGFDDTLEDKIKITILAAGFEVSLDSETPATAADGPAINTGATKGAVATAAAAASVDDEARLREEYGDKVIQQGQEQAESRYIVLKPEDIDNDDMVDLLEKTPTFNRNPKFKAQIAQLRDKHQAAHDYHAREASQAQTKKKGTTGTISFGS